MRHGQGLLRHTPLAASRLLRHARQKQSEALLYEPTDAVWELGLGFKNLLEVKHVGARSHEPLPCAALCTQPSNIILSLEGGQAVLKVRHLTSFTQYPLLSYTYTQAYAELISHPPL